MNGREPGEPQVVCRSWRSRRIAAVLLGAITASAFAFVIAMLTLRTPIPRLGDTEFESAVLQWTRQAPDDYDIQTRVRGRQAAVYRVTVRDGQVQQAWRDDGQLNDQRTMGTWSVDGMLETIRIDLDNRAAASERPVGARSSNLLLSAEFEPHWGYPRRYRRAELGTQMEVSWEVLEFEVVK